MTVAVDLTPEEIAVLERALLDGKPPHEIDDGTVHEKLVALGLMYRRRTPEGDYFGTNENGQWALRVAKRSTPCASDHESRKT